MKNHMKCIVTAIGLAVGVGAASGQSLNEDFRLMASDGTANNYFGNATAIDNGIVVVGARLDDEVDGAAGAVYLFDASTGTELLKLVASDGELLDYFGTSVAIADGIVAVGAAGDDDNGPGSGSAYLFDATTGKELFKLKASDGDPFDYFGVRIAIDNGIVVVGAYLDEALGQSSGSAYLFDATTGKELFKLTASDGSVNHRFSSSVAIDNGIVAIGAYWNDVCGVQSGSAYLFDAYTGVELARLKASDTEAGKRFGISIAIDNGIVAVGADWDNTLARHSGAAYLFDASTGMELFKLTASDGSEDAVFGNSISIDNGTVAVGAKGDHESGRFAGAAYLFNSSTGAELAKLTMSDGITFDQLGTSIGIDNSIVVAGAPLISGDVGTEPGFAYLRSFACRVDMNNDFALNFYDVSAFFGLFVAGDLAVDFNGDGDLNFGDVSIFIADFGKGCPFVN